MTQENFIKNQSQYIFTGHNAFSLYIGRRNNHLKQQISSDVQFWSVQETAVREYQPTHYFIQKRINYFQHYRKLAERYRKGLLLLALLLASLNKFASLFFIILAELPKNALNNSLLVILLGVLLYLSFIVALRCQSTESRDELGELQQYVLSKFWKVEKSIPIILFLSYALVVACFFCFLRRIVGKVFSINQVELRSNQISCWTIKTFLMTLVCFLIYASYKVLVRSQKKFLFDLVGIIREKL